MKKVFFGLIISLSLLSLNNNFFSIQSFNEVAFAADAPVSASPTVSTDDVTGAQKLQSPSSGIKSLSDIFKLFRDFLYTVVGLVLAAMILYGGFTWMTAAGDPEKIKKAQSILLYSFIGVAVIAFSVIIIKLVAAILGINVSAII